MIDTAAFAGRVEFAPTFAPRPGITHVLFDFDGTLSLIRQGWPDVMVPLFAELLPPLPGESGEDRCRLAFEDIMRLNGKQTIYQMIQLAERIRERGGTPGDPLAYKHEYLRRLDERIRERVEALAGGRLRPDDLLVYGSRALLDELQRRGLHLYLASGTDEPYVKREAELLGLTRYFGPHIYGALDDFKKFSKKMVIERILREHRIEGAQLLAFGDGYVEIQNTKEVGGLAVAVASDEAHNGSGQMDEWKRQRLLGVGADVVIPDFRDGKVLLDLALGTGTKHTRCRPDIDRHTSSMNPPPEPLDLTRLRVFPLAERKSLSTLEEILVEPADDPAPLPERVRDQVKGCAARIRSARARGAAVMLIYGAHLVKNGGQLLLVRLLDHGWVTHLATNGAGTIHDWEFSWLGRSTESVRENVATGTFGTWEETGRHLHLALLLGGVRGEGYGRSVGRYIYQDGGVVPTAETLEEAIRTQPGHALTAARADLLQAICRHGLPSGPLLVNHQWRNASPLANAFRHEVPLTVHPGIGYDIITNHPLFNGAVVGRAGGLDFRQFCGSVEQLDGGVVLSIGSAIMGPQVFEKALSCVNNLRRQVGRPVVSGHHFYVVDLQDGGGWDWTQGEPPRENPAYYLRFCKSYSRMGGSMHYVQSDNVTFLHHLFATLKDAMGSNIDI